MALLKSAHVPEDAIVLSEFEASEYVWNIVYDWKPDSEVWALRHGSLILGGLNALSGTLMNRHYRNKLKIGTYGYFSSVIPITVMPAILTTLFHRYIITTDLLLMKNNHCPICYDVRSGAIQLALGFAYPIVLAPLTSLMFGTPKNPHALLAMSDTMANDSNNKILLQLANRYNTARFPELTQPKLLFQFVRKISKPFTGALAAISIVQVLTSSLITHFEVKQSLNLQNKMLEIERKAIERFEK